MPPYQIKILVNDSRAHNKLTSNRYLIEIVPEYHLTIGHFLKHVCNLCELNFNEMKHQIYLQLDGFIIPGKSSISMLKPMDTKIYQIQVKNKKLADSVISQNEIQQEVVNIHKNIQRERQSSPSTPQWQRSRNKKTMIQQKKQQKKKHAQKEIKNNKIKRNRYQHSSSEQFQSSSSLQSLNPKKKIKINECLQKSNTQNLKKQSKALLQKFGLEKQKNSIVKQVTKKLPINEKFMNKNIISNQQMKHRNKRSISKNQNSSDQLNSQEAQVNIPKFQQQFKIVKSAMIPPSNSKQKQQKLANFAINQQLNWLLLSDKSIRLYQENYNKKILQTGNHIRFKIVQFDQENFQPKLSEWIKGQVTNYNGSEIKMKKVNKGSQDFQDYIINIINTSQLSIHKNYLVDTQKQFFHITSNEKSNKKSNKKELKNTQSKPNQTKRISYQQQLRQQKLAKQSYNQSSLEDFICGQINYYFSNKNYQKDKLMQNQANLDPQKYIDLQFILSFPKIKKNNITVQQLSSYLSTDPYLRSRSFELSPNRLRIRKKGALKFHNQHDISVIETNKKEDKKSFYKSLQIQELQEQQQPTQQKQQKQRILPEGTKTITELARQLFQ